MIDLIQINLIIFMFLASVQDMRERKVYTILPILMGLFSSGVFIINLKTYYGALSSIFFSFCLYLGMAFIFTFYLKWGKGDIYILLSLGLSLSILGLGIKFIAILILITLPYILLYNFAERNNWRSEVPYIPCMFIASILSFLLPI